MASSISELALASPTLGRPIRTAIYLPPRFGARVNRAKRYPVVYLLHGLGDDHTAWPAYARVKRTLDRLIRRGRLQPVIVVMPDAEKSWYVNDLRPGGFGPIADAFQRDLITGIDQRFPTLGCREGRAIGGLSMGGYGALLHGFSRPDLFSAVFALSPAVFQENLDPDPVRRARLATLFGGVFGEPFDPALYRKWNIFSRLETIAAGRDAGIGQRSAAPWPSVWLAAGDDDFPSILRSSVRLYQMLQARRIPAELRIDDAAHVWSYWREAIVPALRWLSPRLKRACAPAAQTDAQPRPKAPQAKPLGAAPSR